MPVQGIPGVGAGAPDGPAGGRPVQLRQGVVGRPGGQGGCVVGGSWYVVRGGPPGREGGVEVVQVVGGGGGPAVGHPAPLLHLRGVPCTAGPQAAAPLTGGGGFVELVEAARLVMPSLPLPGLGRGGHGRIRCFCTHF